MVSLIEQIKADLNRPQVKAKSADEWIAVDSHYPGLVEVQGPSQKLVIVTAATDLNGEDYIARHADARRIARVPAMEAALIAADALAKAGERLRDEMIMRQGLARHEAKQAYNAALAAYRKATEAAQ